MQTKVYSRQWLGDKSLEISGNLNALFELAVENGLSITDDLTAGGMIISDISDFVVLDKQVLRNYNGQVHPATAIVPAQVVLGGIGYMEIGVDFKVS